VTVVATIRPDSLDFPLFVHVLGAMILVGALLTATAALAFARGDTRLLRVGYWSLLAVGLPGYVIMRIGAEWIYSKEHLDDLPGGDPAWVGIGYVVADAGALLLLIALIVGGIGVRRLSSDRGTGLLKVTLWISVLVLVAALVAVWAMSAKPD
jgi:hypothetical protein